MSAKRKLESPENPGKKLKGGLPLSTKKSNFTSISLSELKQMSNAELTVFQQELVVTSKMLAQKQDEFWNLKKIRHQYQEQKDELKRLAMERDSLKRSNEEQNARILELLKQLSSKDDYVKQLQTDKRTLATKLADQERKLKQEANDSSLLKCDVCYEHVETPIPCSTCNMKTCLGCTENFRLRPRFLRLGPNKYRLVWDPECVQCKEPLVSRAQIEDSNISFPSSFIRYFATQVDEEWTKRRQSEKKITQPRLSYTQRLRNELQLLESKTELKTPDLMESDSELECPICPEKVRVRLVKEHFAEHDRECLEDRDRYEAMIRGERRQHRTINQDVLVAPVRRLSLAILLNMLHSGEAEADQGNSGNPGDPVPVE